MHLPLLVKFDNLPMFIDLKMHENPPDSGALNDLPEQNLCLFLMRIVCLQDTCGVQ